jgi:hypothetical protein
MKEGRKGKAERWRGGRDIDKHTETRTLEHIQSIFQHICMMSHLKAEYAVHICPRRQTNTQSIRSTGAFITFYSTVSQVNAPYRTGSAPWGGRAP